MNVGIFNRNKTFRPKKLHQKGSKRHELHKHAKATLGSGDMRLAVALPKHEDLNEWLAANTVDFFNEVSLIYETMSEDCTADKCPQMSAGPNFEYLWKDGKEYKNPVKIPAPEYILLLMSWVENQVNDETIFPSQQAASFPRNFNFITKNIFRRLFRVYAHIYYSHFEKVVNIGAEAHLNSCFKHFIIFVIEFDLIEKSELKPLADLISTLIDNPRATTPNK